MKIKKEDHDTIMIQLPKREKQVFMKLCKDRDTSASREIRIFIRAQLKKYAQQSFDF